MGFEVGAYIVRKISKKINLLSDKIDELKEKQNSNSAISPEMLSHLEDYKLFGEDSYVFKDERILHSLYEAYPISMNDKNIFVESFQYILYQNREVGLAISHIEGIERKKEFVSLNTYQDIYENLALFKIICKNPLIVEALTSIGSSKHLPSFHSGISSLFFDGGEDRIRSFLTDEDVFLTIFKDRKIFNLILNRDDLIRIILSEENIANIFLDSSEVILNIKNDENLRNIFYESSDFFKLLIQQIKFKEIIASFPELIDRLADDFNLFNEAVKIPIFYKIIYKDQRLINSLRLDRNYQTALLETESCVFYFREGTNLMIKEDEILIHEILSDKAFLNRVSTYPNPEIMFDKHDTAVLDIVINESLNIPSVFYWILKYPLDSYVATQLTTKDSIVSNIFTKKILAEMILSNTNFREMLYNNSLHIISETEVFYEILSEDLDILKYTLKKTKVLDSVFYMSERFLNSMFLNAAFWAMNDRSLFGDIMRSCLQQKKVYDIVVQNTDYIKKIFNNKFLSMIAIRDGKYHGLISSGNYDDVVFGNKENIEFFLREISQDFNLLRKEWLVTKLVKYEANFNLIDRLNWYDAELIRIILKHIPGKYLYNILNGLFDAMLNIDEIRTLLYRLDDIKMVELLRFSSFWRIMFDKGHAYIINKSSLFALIDGDPRLYKNINFSTNEVRSDDIVGKIAQTNNFFQEFILNSLGSLTHLLNRQGISVSKKILSSTLLCEKMLSVGTDGFASLMRIIAYNTELQNLFIQNVEYTLGWNEKEGVHNLFKNQTMMDKIFNNEKACAIYTKARSAYVKNYDNSSYSSDYYSILNNIFTHETSANFIGENYKYIYPTIVFKNHIYDNPRALNLISKKNIHYIKPLAVSLYRNSSNDNNFIYYSEQIFNMVKRNPNLFRFVTKKSVNNTEEMDEICKIPNRIVFISFSGSNGVTLGIHAGNSTVTGIYNTEGANLNILLNFEDYMKRYISAIAFSGSLFDVVLSNSYDKPVCYIFESI